MREGYLPANERKTILLLSDDCRMFSGIATMSRELILNTCHRFNWIQLGAGINHPETGKLLDLSESARDETGVLDPSIKVIPWNGYGDQNIVRQLLNQFKPDALMHFTDPRYWVWLYQMEHEIRKKIPITYYNIWDDLPYPFWNRDFYKSCDQLLNISRQTDNIVKNVLREENYEDWQIQFLPHGIDHNKFFPVNKKDKDFEKFKSEFLGEKQYDFIAFFNARNIRRKNISDIILSWRTFTDALEPEKARKCLLVLHTAPSDDNGTDLNAVIETFCNQDTCQVRFAHKIHQLDPKELNYYYNLSDVHMFMSSNEGWGLALTESLMAGRMIIAPVTGGMQDQMRFEDEDGNWIKFTEAFGSNHGGRYKKHGKWAIPMFPRSRSIKGSPMTPYISDDTCDFEDGALALMQVYKLDKEERIQRGLAGREWVMSDEAMMTAENMGKNLIKNVETLFEKWQPRRRFVFEKITSIPSNYQNVPMPFTPEFETKIKELV
jgi:hypothetical protein